VLISNGIGDNSTVVEGLKDEVQALKLRCDVLEMAVRDMQSMCDTHQGSLETFRQHVVKLEKQLGMLDLAYQGEQFELMQ